MIIPEAFRQFCGLFYPDGLEDYDSIEEWIGHNVIVLPLEERAILKQFLDQLLNGPCSDDDLADIWASTNPVYEFQPGGHRSFLRKARDLME